MIAQVHLTDEEWQDLRELTRVDDAEGAVRSALAEFRRYARRMRLKELSGQMTMQADAKAGKLDSLVREADEAVRDGTLRDWPGDARP